MGREGEKPDVTGCLTTPYQQLILGWCPRDLARRLVWRSQKHSWEDEWECVYTQQWFCLGSLRLGFFNGMVNKVFSTLHGDIADNVTISFWSIKEKCYFWRQFWAELRRGVYRTPTFPPTTQCRLRQGSKIHYEDDSPLYSCLVARIQGKNYST